MSALGSSVPEASPRAPRPLRDLRREIAECGDEMVCAPDIERKLERARA